MTKENKKIEKQNTADNKKQKIAGLKQSLQSIFGASKRFTLLSYITFIIFIFFFFSEISPANENNKNNIQSKGHFEEIKSNITVKGFPLKLNDGRILIVWGRNLIIFNPKTNKFSGIAAPHDAIALNKGCVLKDGRVLFAGAYVRYPDDAVPVYKLFWEDLEKKFTAGTWKDRPSGMSIPDYRSRQKRDLAEKYQSLTLKEREKIYMPYLKKNPEMLKAYNDYLKDYENSMYAQIYNPDADTWEKTGKLNIRRSAQDMLLLEDGRVLMTGGFAPRTENLPSGIRDESMFERASTIEIFNPDTGLFEEKKNPVKYYKLNALMKLPDKRVFMYFDNEYMFYNLENNTYSEKKKIPYSISSFLMLSNEKMLLFTKSNEYLSDISEIILFDIKQEEFKKIGKPAVKRGSDSMYCLSAAELKDGSVLIFGGEKNLEKRLKSLNGGVQAHKAAEILNIKTGVSARIQDTKYPHINSDNGVLLNDGRILIFDGTRVKSNPAELYIPYKK